MKSILRYVTIVFFILIAAASLVVLLGTPLGQDHTISLSELVSKVNNGEVKEIDIQDNNLNIVLQNNDNLKAKKEPGISAFETLVNLGANKDKMSSIKLEVKSDNSATTIISTILQALLPFLLIVAVFWFMFHQAQKGSMQAFSFGKTKAKLASGA